MSLLFPRGEAFHPPRRWLSEPAYDSNVFHNFGKRKPLRLSFEYPSAFVHQYLVILYVSLFMFVPLMLIAIFLQHVLASVLSASIVCITTVLVAILRQRHRVSTFVEAYETIDHLLVSRISLQLQERDIEAYFVHTGGYTDDVHVVVPDKSDYVRMKLIL